MRNILVLLIALLIGGAAAFYVVTMLSPPKVQAPEPARTADPNPPRIVVAARDLPVGAKISPDLDLTWVEWPASSINQDTMINTPAGSAPFTLDSFKDWYVNVPISAHQPVLRGDHGISVAPPKTIDAPLVLPVNDPTLVRFSFAEAGNIVATGAKKVDIILLRPMSMLGGTDWTEEQPLARNVPITAVDQMGAGQGAEFTVNLDADLVKQIEIARSIGSITLVPSGEVPADKTARVCLGTKCFEPGKFVPHPPPSKDGDGDDKPR